jgi:hypothetical protein
VFDVRSYGVLLGLSDPCMVGEDSDVLCPKQPLGFDVAQH